eukprot:GCRY01005564.1.p1 GENE.GCRY01005564.1~~GCRY01005564.1.p1  ORF type:complete len:576 (-),score=113.11 GCRY01005564.1:189-1916(-)
MLGRNVLSKVLETVSSPLLFRSFSHVSTKVLDDLFNIVEPKVSKQQQTVQELRHSKAQNHVWSTISVNQFFGGLKGVECLLTASGMREPVATPAGGTALRIHGLPLPEVLALLQEQDYSSEANGVEAECQQQDNRKDNSDCDQAVLGPKDSHAHPQIPEATHLLWYMLCGETPTPEQKKDLQQFLYDHRHVDRGVEGLLRHLPPTVPLLTQLSIGLLAMEKHSALTKMMDTHGGQLQQFWRPALEDGLTIVAKFPELLRIAVDHSRSDILMLKRWVPPETLREEEYSWTQELAKSAGLMVQSHPRSSDPLHQLIKLHCCVAADQESGAPSIHAGTLTALTHANIHAALHSAACACGGHHPRSNTLQGLNWLKEFSRLVPFTAQSEDGLAAAPSGELAARLESYIADYLQSHQEIPCFVDAEKAECGRHQLLQHFGNYYFSSSSTADHTTRSKQPNDNAGQQLSQGSNGAEGGESPNGSHVLWNSLQYAQKHIPAVLAAKGCPTTSPTYNTLLGVMYEECGLPVHTDVPRAVAFIARSFGVLSNIIHSTALMLPPERPKSLAADQILAICRAMHNM